MFIGESKVIVGAERSTVNCKEEVFWLLLVSLTRIVAVWVSSFNVERLIEEFQ